MAVGRLARSPGHRPMPGNGVSPGEVGGRKPTRTQGRERCLQHIDDARHRCLHPGRSRLAGDSSPTAAHLPAVPVIENWLTAGNRDSRMRSRSGGRATGVVIVRVPHRNTPTSGGRTPTTPHAPGRTRPWCTRAAQPPGPAMAWVGLTAAGHFPHLTQASLGHFTYRPLRSGQIEGRPLRATIRDATLHRISLTIVNGQPGATGSGPRGTGNGEIDPQPESRARAGEPPPPHRPGTVTAAGRCFLGSFTTTAAYEASIASRTSSSGIAPPTRNVFHPDRPMQGMTLASRG
jgi:hypothetical protein